MSSLRQIPSSRENRAISNGPATEEKKQRSSKNAVSHGLLVQNTVLRDEPQDALAGTVLCLSADSPSLGHRDHAHEPGTDKLSVLNRHESPLHLAIREIQKLPNKPT